MRNVKYVTLVVGKDFYPINFISYRAAFVLAIKGRAEVIKNYPIEEISLNTVNRKFEVPAVIRVNYLGKNFFQKIPSKFSIFVRDNFRCCYCGKFCEDNEITIDHVIPKSKGGAWTWENLVTCCLECNRKKSDKIIFPKYREKIKVDGFSVILKKYENNLHPVIIEFLNEINFFNTLKKEKIKNAG